MCASVHVCILVRVVCVYECKCAHLCRNLSLCVMCADCVLHVLVCKPICGLRHIWCMCECVCAGTHVCVYTQMSEKVLGVCVC